MKNTLHLYLLCIAKPKKLILFHFLLFIVGKGFPQSSFNYEINRPSINSEQFNIGASIETALSKGQPSITIPLFELQGKGYNLPISLVFYGGDVNCETEASTVGLGWSLMAGGCITTTIRGTEDSFIQTDSDAPWQFQEDYLSSMFQNPTERDVFVENMYSDLMPDEYHYSIPGHQGTLEMVSNSQHQYYQKLFPDESYKLNKTANGYTIIADDGTKFIFEDKEKKQSYSNNMPILSTAWFLTRIETAKGGTFQFTYADEEMIDLHDEIDYDRYGYHQSKRIVSVSSEFGSIVFTSSLSRADRSIHDINGGPFSTYSGKITKIELKDETGTLVNGYELYNNSYFTNSMQDTRSNMGWTNYRMRLDSIVEYDASGNRLPPYVFTYSYSFYRAKTCYNQYTGESGFNGKRGSWTETPNFQAIVDLNTSGLPACLLQYPHTPNERLNGFSFVSDYNDGTVDDYFCLSSIKYPTGALDTFEYEPHAFSQIDNNDMQPSINMKIEGKRLKRKVSEYVNGNERTTSITEYKYQMHDSNFSLIGVSSGVLTTPAFHNATLYTWGRIPSGDMGYVANRITSNRPLNAYQGQPVYYKEVEEVIKNNSGGVQKRIIHYMLDNLIVTPMNYIYIRYHNGLGQDHFTPIPNIIYGKKIGYEPNISDYSNQNFAYISYPLGEFHLYSQDGGRPHKEIIIDSNGTLLAKKEYAYSSSFHNVRYGYIFIKNDFTDEHGQSYMSTYNISRSSHYSSRSQLYRMSETTYNYRNGHRDSVVTETLYEYSLGRIGTISTSRQSETVQMNNYYPDYLNVGTGTGLSSEAQAIAALQQKNIIGIPIQTVKRYNNIAVEGNYRDFMVLSGGMIVPKSFYNLSLNNSYVAGPSMSGGAIIKDSGFYLQEEALAYDANFNPIHVSLRTSPDKVYVWGYGGRYPVAVIENYSNEELNANIPLRSMLSQLENFRKVSNQTTSTALKSLNQNIRNALPEGVLVKTYTYDPYYGLTSEFDYSGVGTIYSYDGFGRLSAQYDDNFNLLENYIYHYGH